MDVKTAVLLGGAAVGAWYLARKTKSMWPWLAGGGAALLILRGARVGDGVATKSTSAASSTKNCTKKTSDSGYTDWYLWSSTCKPTGTAATEMGDLESCQDAGVSGSQGDVYWRPNGRICAVE